MVFSFEDKLEDQARTEIKCRGCGKDKGKGTIVCWDCFKYVKKQYKYFEGSFKEWLEQVKANPELLERV